MAADDKEKSGVWESLQKVGDSVKQVAAPYFDPMVQAREEIAKQRAQRGGQASQYEQDLASGQAKQRFQKGFSGN